MNPAIYRERAGVQGWRQFLTGRKQMLDEFDRAKQQAAAHEIATYHGTVAEEQFRRWLSEFLPKRYGVTAGYIVSQGQPDTIKLPHFDVIIFDSLECPTLWMEERGVVRSRALPAEHVRGVLEVKSALDATTVEAAMEHLSDLGPLLAGVDAPLERYKRYLPENFFSSIIFFEMRKVSEFSEMALDRLVPEKYMRGYFGAFVIRGEGLPDDVSGRVQLLHLGEPLQSTVGSTRESLISGSPLANSKPQDGGRYHLGAMLMWTQAAFAAFAFDLVAVLNGTFRTGYMSSLHGMNYAVPLNRTLHKG